MTWRFCILDAPGQGHSGGLRMRSARSSLKLKGQANVKTQNVKPCDVCSASGKPIDMCLAGLQPLKLAMVRSLCSKQAASQPQPVVHAQSLPAPRTQPQPTSLIIQVRKGSQSCITTLSTDAYSVLRMIKLLTLMMSTLIHVFIQSLVNRLQPNGTVTSAVVARPS